MTIQDLLAKLVSFPALGGQSNLELIHWINDYLEHHRVATRLLPNEAGDKASLHCRIGPATDGGVILSGHTDVVPVAGQDWDTDPFELVDKGDGKLYGRGSCDMKGFIACCLAALPEMLEAKLQRPIYLAFSYDEEVGCLAGAELADDIRAYYEETPRYAIIGEPSLMQPIVGQKGMCSLEIRVNGTGGHSSRVRQEVSAVHEAARLILWLEDKMNALVEAGRVDHRFDPPHTSLHCGIMHGGIAHNVVADQACFSCDIRTIPMDALDDVLADWQAHCRAREQVLRRAFPGFEIQTLIHFSAVPPLDTPEDRSIVDLVKRLSGQDTTGTVAYAAEAGQFAEAGFETVICGPGSIEQAHRANEFIARSELEKGSVFLRRLVKELCAALPPSRSAS